MQGRDTEPLTMSVQEAADYIGVSHRVIREYCKRKDGLRLPHITAGNRCMIIRASIPEWLQKVSDANASGDYQTVFSIYQKEHSA